MHDKPEIIGVYPTYNNEGHPIALVYAFRGEEDRCRRRAVAVGKAIAKFDDEPYTDNTQGPPLLDMAKAHKKVLKGLPPCR